MDGINEIKTQTAQKQADIENSRNGTFCVLRDGSILLRSGSASKTIDSKEDAAAFLETVRERSSGFIRGVVQSYFAPALA